MYGIFEMRASLLFIVCMTWSCATRYEKNCEAPAEYRKKSVATILKEAKAIVSRPGEKRAVVFGLYGNKKQYVKGLLENIEMAKDMYPTWDVVAFIDSATVPKEAIAEAKARGAVVKESPDYNSASARFYILDLPEYDRFIVRDADSRIYPREVAAVADWMKNDWAILHGMRDAHNHLDPLLGGMWGAVSKRLREKLELAFHSPSMQDLYKEYIGNRKAVYGDDQIFLKEYVVKAVGPDHFLSHETFLCHAFPNSRGFPIPRGNAGVHIGAVRNVD